MYMNNAYINDSLLNYKDTTKPLSIGSCGTYHLFTIPNLPTYRPHGRLDYQLIYIASGVAHFFFGENAPDTIIPAGTVIIFRPKEYQKYIYYGIEKTEVFWIHFSGNSVKNILRNHGISDDMHIIKTGTKLVFSNTFKNIINEIQQRQNNYELMVDMYFRQLLINISREYTSEKNGRNSYIDHEIEMAQQYFNENYNVPISIEDYASSHGMSISWFIRNFRERTGSTPLQYILSLKLNNAQSLLEATDYSINEISNIVGYDNQLYFSRLFVSVK